MKLVKRARDGIYMLSYTDEQNKRKRISTGTRERVEAERQAQLIMAGQGPRAQGYTISDALDEAWRRRWKDQKGQRQLSYVVARVTAEIGSLQCRDLSYAVLEEYADHLAINGLAPATINHRLGVISVALDMAAKRNKIPSVPPIPRQRMANKRIRYITRDEEAVLLSKTTGAIHRLIVVLVDTGCRLSEITSALPEDIVGRDIRIIDSKNGKSRAVPLTARAQYAMRALHSDPKWRVITARVRHSDTRKASAKDWCVKQFTKARNASDMPDVSLHVLRHTCASRLVQAGVDLYKVKEWLGHSSITMTERYAHLAPDALREVAHVLEQPTADVVELRR